MVWPHSLLNISAETNGSVLKYGEAFPAFELVRAVFKPVKDSDFAGKRLVLSIFPSFDTEACSASVCEFNERAAYVEDMYLEWPAVRVGRFCAAESCDGGGLLLHVCDDCGKTIQAPPANGLRASGVVVIKPYSELSL